MKILILGCNGYLGQRLSLEARLRGHKVVGMDQHYKNLAGVHEYYMRDLYPIDHWTWGNIQREVEQAPFVINLIGLVGYKKCDENPELATTLNEDFPPILANANVLHFSAADSIYGKQPEEIATVTEKTRPNPVSHYGKTKLAGEESLLELNQMARVIRLSSVFGISPLMRWDVLIHDWIKTAIQTNDLEVFQPNAIRNFTLIDTIIKAIFGRGGYLENLESKPKIQNINNLSTPKITLAKSLKVRLFPNLKITEIEGSDPEHRNYVVDTEYNRIFSIYEGAISDQFSKVLKQIIERHQVDFPSN